MHEIDPPPPAAKLTAAHLYHVPAQTKHHFPVHNFAFLRVSLVFGSSITVVLLVSTSDLLASRITPFLPLPLLRIDGAAVPVGGMQLIGSRIRDHRIAPHPHLHAIASCRRSADWPCRRCCSAHGNLRRCLRLCAFLLPQAPPVERRITLSWSFVFTSLHLPLTWPAPLRTSLWTSHRYAR